MILRPPPPLFPPLTLSSRLTSPLNHIHNASLARYTRTRPLSTSPRLDETHYETLRLPPTATKSDLKKSFYALSKETHPDTNPNDTDAAARFTKVSEAYSVLANDEKRAVYDAQIRAHERSNASRSGGTYAGSRAPTGLVKQRGTFRGPPPSFYASGGSTAAREDAERRQGEAARERAYNASNYGSDAAGTWDPGFNSRPIFNTQTAEDERRKHRRRAEMAAAQAYAEEEGAFWGRFIAVSAVVGVGVGIGSLLVSMGVGGGRGGLVQGDGSRRRKVST